LIISALYCRDSYIFLSLRDVFARIRYVNTAVKTAVKLSPGHEKTPRGTVHQGSCSRMRGAGIFAVRKPDSAWKTAPQNRPKRCQQSVEVAAAVADEGGCGSSSPPLPVALRIRRCAECGKYALNNAEIHGKRSWPEGRAVARLGHVMTVRASFEPLMFRSYR
jgi:hypothetical protein